MGLIFHGSAEATIGVEIELQLIDPETLDLTPQSDQILQICQLHDEHRVKKEIHQSMVEVDSEISKDVKECRQFLNDRMLRLSNIVENNGLQIAVTGTHPFQHWGDRLISNADRYHNLHDKFQWLVRRMNIYGMHVHIGVNSGERALAICNSMTRFLPHLLALSANSPFWHGINTGMQSSRINILDSFPYKGLPVASANWAEFEHYHDTLLQVGAIKSFKDLYWYVRPNIVYGTVEVRICDAMTTLDETMALVALIQCLVAQINADLEAESEQVFSREEQWIAPENIWIAARDGLDGMIITDLQGNREKISDLTVELVKKLIPLSKKLNCFEELIFIEKIIQKGNGAQRQLRTFQDTGSLKSVVSAAQREFISSLNVYCAHPSCVNFEPRESSRG
ncbi:MAG: YbdK family carboxylate-amine ligase [Verrucomicrobia bacterium]|nr:YbdK family carboxylate-amine ligase [Verrucomicrobiota bacterium]